LFTLQLAGDKKRDPGIVIVLVVHHLHCCPSFAQPTS